MAIAIIDEILGQGHQKVHSLEHLSPNGESVKITARELIKIRIELEFEKLDNEEEKENPFANWLIRPTTDEAILNGRTKSFGPGVFGFEAKKPKEPKKAKILETAINEFVKGHYFIIANDKQITEIDEEIELKNTSELIFIKLIPLAGG